ncbi:MAG: hypothetical protein RJA70_423 [Pseudomonadota bacterium]|jgi:hypothetical protein
MKACWLLIVTLGLTACGDNASTRATRSLRGSGDVSFFCAAEEPNGQLQGRPLDACPDTISFLEDGESRSLYSLVTQVETGEVALVRMSGCAEGGGCSAQVLDLEPTQPAANFHPVGAEPTSVVSTPGGLASFVAVAEPGREGLFGLPTSCIGPRETALEPGRTGQRDKQPLKDLRSWPACRLPAAPGDMEVLFSPTDGRCAAPVISEDNSGAAECPVDLSQEQRVSGRHKIAVALPTLGQIAIVDAQSLLNRAPGTFEDCPIDRLIQLATDVPLAGRNQSVPEDMRPTSAACGADPEGYEHAPQAQGAQAYPSDFALFGQTLYVADRGVSAVHVLDVAEPCDVKNTPPLLPRSYLDPSALVTTRKVAVSPITPSGQQFVYAVDNTAGGAAGSVMVFDVSPGGSQRTPILRPRSSRIVTEPPDRLQFNQEIADVTFAYQDVPEIDPTTGVAVDGLSCDPDPELSTSNAAARYRANPEGSGAAPGKLRGVFAFVAFHSGVVVVVDVEDLDAPCRRPRTTNPDAELDSRGCANDTFNGEFMRPQDGTVTVSDELSCNIFEPHRSRPRDLFRADASSPRLRSFPQLRDEKRASVTIDPTSEGRRQPRLIGVPVAKDAAAAELWVGGTRYTTKEATDALVLDPANAQRNSVVLPYSEPRAYVGSSVTNTVTFEGVVQPVRDARFRVKSGADIEIAGAPLAAPLESSTDYGVFLGESDAQFCSSGVEDLVLSAARGERLFSEELTNPADYLRFAERHGDYAQVTGALLEPSHSYWAAGGAQCREVLKDTATGLSGREVCDLYFGTPQLPDAHREFRVLRAFNDRLIVEPRSVGGPIERAASLGLLECCFPELVEFEVRASNQWIRRSGGGFEHDVVADRDTLACETSCNPQLSGRSGRTFEISCGEGRRSDAPLDPMDPCSVPLGSGGSDLPIVGPRRFFGPAPSDAEKQVLLQDPAIVCVLKAHPAGGIAPTGPFASCIHDSATGRFVVYRGAAPSRRGMEFSWTTLGGYSALGVDLLRLGRFDASSIPRRIEFVPQVGRLVIADGGLLGMEVISLRTAGGQAVFGGSQSAAF